MMHDVCDNLQTLQIKLCRCRSLHCASFHFLICISAIAAIIGHFANSFHCKHNKPAVPRFFSVFLMIVIVLLGLHNIKKINMDHPAYVKFNKQLLNAHMLHKEQHLDKCKSVQICSSVLSNRSLRGDEWFWMSGQSMNFLNWPQDFVPDCYSSTCGGMTSTEHLLWQDQPCEESLNFICQSGFTYTTLRLVCFYCALL